MPRRSKPKKVPTTPAPLIRGDRIVELRKAKGWLQKDLASATTLHAPAISELEGASPRDIRISTLHELCRELDCSADYLLGLSNHPGRRL